MDRDKIVKLLERLTDEHMKKSNAIDSEGNYQHYEYKTGTYAMGYSQALIDIYKAIKK